MASHYSIYKILSTTTTATITATPTSLSSQPNHKINIKSLPLPNPWLNTTHSLHFSNHNHHATLSTTKFTAATSSTVVSSLPTAKRERAVANEEVPKWSWRAIKSFTMAELEARKLKSPYTGTEALLMGILKEGTSLASKFLRANGITLSKVHEEAVNLHGQIDKFFFSPEHPPLTAEAQKALDWAIDHKIKSGNSGEVTTSDMLLGIWSEVESPGHKMLATFGFNDEKAKELETLSAGPNFVDG
ncbi:hypothetical protein ACFE04_015359 [Oxalis oulophora]